MHRFLFSILLLSPFALLAMWLTSAWETPAWTTVATLLWSVAALGVAHLLLHTPIGAMLTDKTHGLLIGYDTHKIQNMVYIKGTPFHFMTQDLFGHVNAHAYHGVCFRTTHTHRNFILLSGALSSTMNVAQTQRQVLYRTAV